MKYYQIKNKEWELLDVVETKSVFPQAKILSKPFTMMRHIAACCCYSDIKKMTMK